MRTNAAKDADRSELQRLRFRNAERVLHCAARCDDGRVPERDDPRLPAVEPARRSNHRYTTELAIKAQMQAQGYVAEGYGPNAVIMCAPTPGTATVKFLSVSGAPNGVLVSDGSSIATANYQGYATPVDNVNVGMRSGAGEAIAFSEHRPVAVQSVAWATGGGDQTVNMSLANEFDTPVTIWVVAGPYSTTQATALTLWQTAQQIYWDERLGVQLSLEVVNATANPKAPTWSAFTCGTNNANVAAIQSDIGARAG